MANPIIYHSYQTLGGGDAMSRFSIRGQMYEYHMSKSDAETVHWLKKKSVGKALNVAKKRAYKTVKASEMTAAKGGLRTPENWDVLKSGKDYKVLGGGNDWEPGLSAMWVEQQDRRIWCNIKHSKTSDEIGNASKEEDKEWAEHGAKAWETWIEVAKELAKASHEDNMKNHSKPYKWSGGIPYDYFREALTDKRMNPFVKETGEENHVWKSTKTASMLLDLAKKVLG